MRVQLALCMLIVSSTGVRPGTILEPQYHVGSNDGLLYKDVEVILVQANGVLIFPLQIMFRTRKCRRRPELVRDFFFEARIPRARADLNTELGLRSLKDRKIAPNVQSRAS